MVWLTLFVGFDGLNSLTTEGETLLSAYDKSPVHDRWMHITFKKISTCPGGCDKMVISVRGTDNRIADKNGLSLSPGQSLIHREIMRHTQVFIIEVYSYIRSWRYGNSRLVERSILSC